MKQSGRLGYFFPWSKPHFWLWKKKKKSKISIVGHLCGGEEFWPWFPCPHVGILQSEQWCSPPCWWGSDSTGTDAPPVLNPAGYYLFLGGAVYPPVAYYIENARFSRWSVARRESHINAHTHAHRWHFHTWMDKGQSLDCPRKFLTFQSRWTGQERLYFLLWWFFFLSPQILSEGICVVAGSVFPSPAYLQTQSKQSWSPPLLKSAWSGGSHLRWKSTQVSPSNMGRTLWRTARGTLVATRFSLKTLQKSTS